MNNEDCNGNTLSPYFMYKITKEMYFYLIVSKNGQIYYNYIIVIRVHFILTDISVDTTRQRNTDGCIQSHIIKNYYLCTRLPLFNFNGFLLLH